MFIKIFTLSVFISYIVQLEEFEVEKTRENLKYPKISYILPNSRDK